MLETREGGCHCGRVRFKASVDLDLLSQCSCTVCTKKGILHLPVDISAFQLLRGKNALTVYTFETGVARHPFCTHCGMHPFYIPQIVHLAKFHGSSRFFHRAASRAWKGLCSTKR